MSLIPLGESNINDLKHLTNLDPTLVVEFSKLAIESIKKGPRSKKIFASAAQRLELDADVVEHGVQGLAYLFIEGAKLNIGETSFAASLLDLNFSIELNEQLYGLYNENSKEIRKILTQLSLDLPHYQNLDWRLDVQLASRSLRSQINPVFILKLETTSHSSEDVQTQYMETDFNNLRHLTNELELALQELKSAHARRIMRNIK